MYEFPYCVGLPAISFLQGPGGRNRGLCSRHATDVEVTPARLDGRYVGSTADKLIDGLRLNNSSMLTSQHAGHGELKF